MRKSFYECIQVKVSFLSEMLKQLRFPLKLTRLFRAQVHLVRTSIPCREIWRHALYRTFIIYYVNTQRRVVVDYDDVTASRDTSGRYTGGAHLGGGGGDVTTINLERRTRETRSEKKKRNSVFPRSPV